MSVKIQLSNKVAYTILAIAVVLILIGIVYALTPGTAPNPGHTVDTIAPPTGCTAGQVLKWTGTAWQCGASGGITSIVCVTHGAERKGACTSAYPTFFGSVGKSSELTCDDCGSCTYCNICCKIT